MGLLEATAANMFEMIGIGPFITIPLIIAAMGGPLAIIGWILGAALSGHSVSGPVIGGDVDRRAVDGGLGARRGIEQFSARAHHRFST